jgi:DNA-binding beta-propeller fold protein YncE
MRAVTRIVGSLLVLVLAAGCVPAGGRQPADQTAAGPSPVWPEPPARPRVRFVRSVARPADLGISPSFWRRVGEAVTGRQQEWLVRPTSVSVKGDEMYVADPGAQALWVISSSRRRFEKTQRAAGATLVSPVAVAVGRDARIYVADSFLAKVFVYGSDLTPLAAIEDRELVRPAGLAYDDARGRLYVADSGAHRISIYSPDGQRVGALGQRGTGDGEFNFPSHVTVDRAGMVYVTDGLGFRVQMFDSEGRFLGQFGREGDSSGDFARPKGIAVDSEGHVYVVEALFDAFQIFDRRGRFFLSVGERGIRPGQFWLPVGIFIDGQDRIYVADSYNQRIQVLQYLPGGADE